MRYDSSKHAVSDAIVWEDGDCVSYRFKDGDDKIYIYVREDGSWPGLRSWTGLDDTRVTAAFCEGRAQVICDAARVQEVLAELAPLPQELWYCWDQAGDAAAAVFPTEIEALRYAVGNGTQAEKRTWGALW